MWQWKDRSIKVRDDLLISELKQIDMINIYFGPIMIMLLFWHLYQIFFYEINLFLKMKHILRPQFSIFFSTNMYIWINVDVNVINASKLNNEYISAAVCFNFSPFPFLGWTPLHKASSEGADDIIVELLRAGANVNCEDLDGILPLHNAVANNHLKVQCTSDLAPITLF